MEGRIRSSSWQQSHLLASKNIYAFWRLYRDKWPRLQNLLIFDIELRGNYRVHGWRKWPHRDTAVTSLHIDVITIFFILTFFTYLSAVVDFTTYNTSLKTSCLLSLFDQFDPLCIHHFIEQFWIFFFSSHIMEKANILYRFSPIFWNKKIQTKK